MTDDFALKWAYVWLAALGLLAVSAFAFRLPVPSSAPLCFILGVAYGAAMIGPIVYISLRRP